MRSPSAFTSGILISIKINSQNNLRPKQNHFQRKAHSRKFYVAKMSPKVLYLKMFSALKFQFDLNMSSARLILFGRILIVCFITITTSVEWFEPRLNITSDFWGAENTTEDELIPGQCQINEGVKHVPLSSRGGGGLGRLITTTKGLFCILIQP